MKSGDDEFYDTHITQAMVRKMSFHEMMEILIDGTKGHVRGAGTGIHSVPTGRTLQRFAIALAKAHRRIYKFDARDGYADCVYWRD